MFMQMKTYWSGKKNQYLQPGGIKVRGNWQQYEENGKKYYYQVNENGIAQVDLPPVTEDQLKDTDIRVPFIQWKGLWQEGVFMTMADVWKQKSHDVKNWLLIPRAFYWRCDVQSYKYLFAEDKIINDCPNKIPSGCAILTRSMPDGIYEKYRQAVKETLE